MSKHGLRLTQSRDCCDSPIFDSCLSHSYGLFVREWHLRPFKGLSAYTGRIAQPERGVSRGERGGWLLHSMVSNLVRGT